MRKKLLLQIGLIGSLLLSATAFADDDGTVVPVSTLKPAVKMDKPVLTGAGGPLILSDSPESPRSEGAYYRDKVSGEFRVFWHHQNMTGKPLTIAVALTNTTNEPVMLYTKGVGVGTDYYPDVAGQDALAVFMQERSEKKLAAVLQPGETHYLADLTPDTHTTSGIAQFDAVTQRGHTAASVTVTTLGYTSQPANPLDVAVLPGDRHVRGTFPHFDRVGTLHYNTSAGNTLIRISSAATGQWSDSMPGEYEEGYNAIDGTTVINNGNYGVMYKLQVEINNESDENRIVSVYDNPSGGAGHYVVGWGNDFVQSPFLTYLYAWKISDFKVNKKGKTVETELSLTGGAAGPQVLYFTNERVD